MSPPFTKADRDALLARHRGARVLHEQAMDTHVAGLDMPGEIGIDDGSSVFVDTPAYAQARAAQATMVSLEEEYCRRLPRLPMAVCPFCEKPLYRAFDPFGLDGLWWRSSGVPAEEPAACPHFCVLLGAVRLGEQPVRPDFEVHPGPGAPFVMPRLLGLPGMTAVLGEIPMADGGLAYPAAYFALRRPPAQTLAASWGRTNFVYTTQLGEHGWRAADGAEAWDFELESWVNGGRLRWCDPGGDRTRLGAGLCPYLRREGGRAPQRISRYLRAGDPG